MGPCAELCRAMLGWAGLLQHHWSCNAHRCKGSGRVQGCYSVTGPVCLRLHESLCARRAGGRARARLPRFEPAGLSALSKVASRSLSGLTRHADGRWALLMCFLERLSILSFLWARVLLHILLWVGVCKLWRSPSKAYESGRTLWGFIGW